MGVAYKAEGTKLKRAVGLKFLSAHLTVKKQSRDCERWVDGLDDCPLRPD